MIREIRFHALGPLAVFVDEEEVELGRGNERTLLALLVLNAGRPLSSDAVIDALWGERPPPTAPEMVRNYIVRARKRIGDDAIETIPGGYRLRADPDSIDWVRFERLATEGAQALERNEPQEALERFEDALSLWRGRPLPELDVAHTGQSAIARLEELQLRVVEDRVDAELELGRSNTLIPELEQFVQEHPYRERPLGQLMLALYRCGRQKDALERYQAGRRLLVEEAGLEPGRQLQQLHLSILRHDPSLDLRAQSESASSSDPASPVHPWRRTALLAAAAAAVAAAIALPLTLGGKATVTLTSRSLAVLDPGSGAAVRTLRLPGPPGPLAVSSNAVWIGQLDPASLVQVAQRTLRIEHVVHLSAMPYSVAAGDGAAWVGNAFFGTLTHVDATGRPTGPFRPQPRSTGRLPLAYGLGSLWVGSQDGTLSRLEPATNDPSAVIPLNADPEAVAVSSGSVWVAEAARDGVLRVNPRTGRVTAETPIGGRGSSIAIGDGAVWVVTEADGHLWRIDPHNEALTASIEVGGEPAYLAATAGAVWVATRQGILTEVDPHTNSIERTVALGHAVAGLASGDGRLWVTLS